MGQTTGGVPRLCQSWMDSFIDLTEGTQSPLIFRKWAAASIIAGALERRCWVKAGRRTLYPNLYTLLIGPPGVGKTDAIREIFEFAQSLPELHMAPSNVSRASLIDALVGASRSLLRPMENPPHITYNALFAAADELGVFLAQYESSFMSSLNKLYDGTIYTETKRGMKIDIKIERPLLNIMAGTTPAWLGGNLPETAWAEGFSSRLILIYSGDRIKIDLFAEMAFNDDLRAKLELDLKDIFSLYGQFHWDESVVEAFSSWYMADCPPRPEHPRLEHYLPRRHIHFLKLCMVFSASRGNDLVIRMVDYQSAMDMFLEAEASMPDVFRAMKSVGSDSNTIDECYAFVYQIYNKENKGVSEHRIINFLAQRIPSHSVHKVLEIMTSSRILEVEAVGAGAGGRNTYRPAPKALHNS